MKSFLLFVVGVLCAVAYFKWDEIRTYAEDFLAEHGISIGFTGTDGGDAAEPPDEGTIDDDTLFQLASDWQNGGKRRAIDKLDAMKNLLDSRTSCPAYHYAKPVAAAARSAIIAFEQAIGRDDYAKAGFYDNAASDAMRKFTLNCRWKAGVSRGDGTHSGSVEGTWEPDAGRVMVGGRAMRVFRCGNCSGGGTVRSEEYCPSCNGRGRVANPAAQISDAVNMGVGIASMFGGRNAPRIQPPRVASEITCSRCNGQGRIPTTRTCSECGGKGQIFQP